MTYVDFSLSVKAAIAKKKPIVALESTIISHGMPFPDNLIVANTLEQIIRDNGATPATIAIINGRIKIGLETAELQFLANQGQDVVKTSRRDLPIIVAQKMHGATTVATTMYIAAMAKINVFATGGIGGVHRGGEYSMDISADLQELARTNVAVISAGVKSILDIPRTLEYLETFGVPVIGYQTEEFPAFYTQKSGCCVDVQMNNPTAIANMLKTKWELGLDGGVLVANPIPEQFSYDKGKIDHAIAEALDAAKSNNIKGKAITPFLLSKITNITGGQSLQSNIELVKNNAALAAKIAVELSKINDFG